MWWARWGSLERFEYVRRANEEVLVIALIEVYNGVQNSKKILTVEGIDMIMLGPGDLAQSMGFPPRGKVEAMLLEVVRETVAAGKWVSQGDVSLGDDKDAQQYIQMGCRFWDIGTHSLLRRGAQEYIGWLKGLGAPL